MRLLSRQQLLRRVSLVVLVAGALAGPARASSIVNVSFEAVPSSATGQGLLPSGWLDATSIVPGADTYSNDGSYGLAPGSFGNFNGVTAFDGIRWVAGAAFGRLAGSTTVGGEGFGTFFSPLSTTLTPGDNYELKAVLHQAVRSDLNNPGGYDLFLAAGNSPTDLAGAVLLGSLAPTTGTGGWEARSVTFVAPADASLRPFLIFAPYQSGAANAYPGIDAVSLVIPAVDVPEPTSIALLGIGIASAAGYRWRRRHPIPAC